MLKFDRAEAILGSFRLSADFTVQPGARVAVIGPSGSGKSTLLGMVSGFVPLSSGRIDWNGADLSRQPPGDRPVSVLFQDQNLFPHLTVAQNAGLGLRPDLKLSAQQKAAVEGALRDVGLEGMAGRRPGNMSGGQQGRVALARVALRARPILLLDEAFSALGPALKSDMLALLGRIADDSGATVLMVTHDPDDARAFAPQTIVVMDGTAQPPAPTAELLDNPPEALAAYLG
ncbi:thiamine ABC transporter ATP-binding protein [Paracoccus aerodenitrificans]|uniref:thiamine ABC transporter ATP-binding protein n=1 Tax=Paracoccus aerodenitrificans TaxID=3017781 RepID=UPI0022F0D9EB|nr:ATP-binding cassette domain-containing protein [Paracoccus aerodenitrificans]WBU64552.1 ATP-binding cassette domain-containing protein [Paracoccus aerodenitrificans]